MSDDSLEFVADRLGLGLAYLYTINSVRRDGPQLFIGDSINLSAFHITSIGDQNGVVSDNSPPSPMPQQRPSDVP